MLGKGRQSGKRLHRGQSRNFSEEYCVCPQCGYSTPHEQGIPCNTKKCPECNVFLIREQNANVTNNQMLNHKESKNMDLPGVNADLCTGCGACIDVCPMEAIIMEDGIAKIDEEKCSNCRVCEDECPVEAIN